MAIISSNDRFSESLFAVLALAFICTAVSFVSVVRSQPTPSSLMLREQILGETSIAKRNQISGTHAAMWFSAMVGSLRLAESVCATGQIYACVGVASVSALVVVAGAFRALLTKKRGVHSFTDALGTRYNIDLSILNGHVNTIRDGVTEPLRTEVGSAVNGGFRMVLHHTTYPHETGHLSAMGASPYRNHKRQEHEAEDSEENIYVEYVYDDENKDMEKDLGQKYQDDMVGMTYQAYTEEDLYYQGVWGAQYGEGDTRSECGYFTQSEGDYWFFHAGEAQSYMKMFC